MVVHYIKFQYLIKRYQNENSAQPLIELEETALMRWRKIDIEIEQLMESVEDQLTQIQIKVELINGQVESQTDFTGRLMQKANRNEVNLDDVNEKTNLVRSHLSSPSKLICDFILIVMTIMLVVMLISEVGKM